MEEKILPTANGASINSALPTEDEAEDTLLYDGDSADSLAIDREADEGDGQSADGEPEGEVLPDAPEDGEDGEEIEGATVQKPPAPTKVNAAPSARFTAIPRRARRPELGMTGRELREARDIFQDLSDREIYELYRKVTK